MKQLVYVASLMVAAGVWCADVSSAHGGAYSGPSGPPTTTAPGSDPNPPPAPGPTTGGGTYGGPGDTTPKGGPSTPLGGPSTGGGNAPKTPGPSTGGSRPPATPGAGPSGPSSPSGPGTPAGNEGVDTGLDLTRWQYWWELNKERYLDLAHGRYAREVTTDSEGFFLDPEGETAVRDQLRPALDTIQGVVVPGLLDALAKDKSNDVVSGVLIALAKIGETRDANGRSQFTERTTPFLHDANQEIVETAALALGILGDEANFELLVPLMRNDRASLRAAGVDLVQDVSERTRAFAAYALGLIGSRASEVVRAEIVAQIVKFMEHDGRSMRSRDLPVACVIAIGLVPLRADPTVTALDLSKAGAQDARIKSREAQVMWLRELFQDRKVDDLVRAHAPRAMAKLCADLAPNHWARSAVAMTLLGPIADYSRENSAVQQSCALALGGLGDCDTDDLDTRMRKGLMHAYESNPDQQLKRFALIALAQSSGRPGEAGKDPIAALSNKDPNDNPRSFLLERLSKAPSGERCWAALALGVQERSLADSGRPMSIDVRTALRLSLATASASDEIGAFAIALGIMRDQLATDALRSKFERVGDPDARGYVALALGMIGDVESVGAIQKVVARSKYQPELLRSAAIALGLLGDRRVVDDLIAMLQSATGLSSQAAIASALGTIGDARSIQPLVAMLADQQKTSLARGFAAAALGIVGDKDRHPWVSRISLDLNYRASTETLLSGNNGLGILEIL
jgi:HEAT repeat protein